MRIREIRVKPDPVSYCPLYTRPRVRCLCLEVQRSSVSGRSPAVFAIAAETGWTEERILFMPLARLFQYQHCLLRRNGVRANWSSIGESQTRLREQLKSLRARWNREGRDNGD